jgi:hypothetical protein
LLNFFYHDRILGQAGRKIGESVGSISRGRPLIRTLSSQNVQAAEKI